MIELLENQAVCKTVRILKNGGVAAVPTETVYGLVALWRDDVARERIYGLKRRPHEKRLQMLADSVETACRYGLLVDERLEKLARAFWPGGLTVVARAVGGDSIGLRIPSHPFVLSLLKELGEPLAATSANLAGEAPGLTAQDAIAHLDGEPDVLVDGGYATVTGGAASTVVSILEAKPVVLRAGRITIEQIEEALK